MGGLGYSSTVFFQSRDKTQGLACMIEAFVESKYKDMCVCLYVYVCMYVCVCVYTAYTAYTACTACTVRD